MRRGALRVRKFALSLRDHFERYFLLVVIAGGFRVIFNYALLWSWQGKLEFVALAELSCRHRRSVVRPELLVVWEATHARIIQLAIFTALLRSAIVIH